jgi:hypothetical protein
MREIRTYGSEGGGAQLNEPLLPLSAQVRTVVGARGPDAPAGPQGPVTAVPVVWSARG